MYQPKNFAKHEAYATDYDKQVKDCSCHITDLLFGLAYEYTQPGQVLLEIGIGSGLLAQLFAMAGLEVYGMDFSPTMLKICSSKGFAARLKQHDIQLVPWPYQDSLFDMLASCGVFHFIADLESSFNETRRVLREGGLFLFTTKLPTTLANTHMAYDLQTLGGFEIFSHSSAYVEALLKQHGFSTMKMQKCYVGDDLFILWIAQKTCLGHIA